PAVRTFAYTTLFRSVSLRSSAVRAPAASSILVAGASVVRPSSVTNWTLYMPAAPATLLISTSRRELSSTRRNRGGLMVTTTGSRSEEHTSELQSREN